MRAAAIQMNSTADKQRNLATAERLVRAAAADGSTLVVLPEKFNVLGTPDQLVEGAEPLDGPTLAWARALAQELSIDLVAGSIPERRAGRDKLANTSVHIGPDGVDRAAYRKIHMFDVTVGGREYRESATDEAGDEIVLSDSDGVSLGLTVCYDLRFPELFRILAVRGARIFSVPSAFTAVTGAAHWDTLVRARAIENQAFVVAADQVGVHPGGNESYGGSQIVDPWGDVLARADDERECFVAADVDLARQDEIRATLPSLANRVAAAYRWPQQAGA
ncbi:MAG TPA: carbon-nitrogen hydrolase family protein [Thermoleophilaceae bacterium]|nr:carbon-nitrogen hydrolase family protein [Thermoleophilaceae bacterium]